MAIKGYSAFPKTPALLEPHHQVVLYHILVNFFLSLCILVKVLTRVHRRQAVAHAASFPSSQHQWCPTKWKRPTQIVVLPKHGWRPHQIIWGTPDFPSLRLVTQSALLIYLVNSPHHPVHPFVSVPSAKFLSTPWGLYGLFWETLVYTHKLHTTILVLSIQIDNQKNVLYL